MSLIHCFFLFVGGVWSLDVCADDSSIETTINQQKVSPEYQRYCRNNPSQRHPYYQFVEWWSLERACHPEKDKDGRITQALLERAVGFGGWSKTAVAKPDEVTIYKNVAFLHYWGVEGDQSPQNTSPFVRCLLHEQWQAARQKRCLLVGAGWLHPLNNGKPTKKEPCNILGWLQTLADKGWCMDTHTIDQCLNQHFDIKDSARFEITVADNLLKQYSSKPNCFGWGYVPHLSHNVSVTHVIQETHVDEHGNEISRTTRQAPPSSALGQSNSYEGRIMILPPVPEELLRESPLFYTHAWAMLGGTRSSMKFCQSIRKDFSKRGNPDQLIYQRWQEDHENPLFLMIIREMQKERDPVSLLSRANPLFDQIPPETNSTASQRAIPDGGDNASLDNLMPKYADGMERYTRFLSHFNPENSFDEMQNHMSSHFEEFRSAQKFFEDVVHAGGANSFISQVNTKYPALSDERRSKNEDVYQDFVAFLKIGVDRKWWSALPEGLSSRLIWMVVNKEKKFEHRILREKRNSPKNRNISFFAKDDPVYQRAEEKVNDSRPLKSSIPSDVARFVKDFLSQCPCYPSLFIVSSRCVRKQGHFGVWQLVR